MHITFEVVFYGPKQKNYKNKFTLYENLKTQFRFFISVLALFVTAWCMNILLTSIKFKCFTQIFQLNSLVVGNYLLFQFYVQIAEVNLLCKPTSSYRVIYYSKVISHYPTLTSNHFSHIDHKNIRIISNSPYKSMVKTHNKLLKRSLWGKPNKASPVK